MEAERPAPAMPTDDVPGEFDQVVPEPSQSKGIETAADIGSKPRLLADASLMDRFTAVAPHPRSPEDDALWGAWLRLVRTLQRALTVLRKLGGRLAEHEGRAEPVMAAKLETDYELDEARRRRAVASERAAR